MNDAAFDLVRAKMEAAKRDAIALMEREVYGSMVSRPLPPPTWRDRLRWKRMRVTGYFSTLWQALRGTDLVVREDWD